MNVVLVNSNAVGFDKYPPILSAIYDAINEFLFSLIANQNDTIDPEIILPANRAICKFGNLTLLYGQQLKSENNDVICKCSIPPMITCSKKVQQHLEIIIP